MTESWSFLSLYSRKGRRDNKYCGMSDVSNVYFPIIYQVLNFRKYFSQFNIHIATKSTFYISSRPKMFCKIGVLKNFAKFTGKNLC